MSKFNFTYRGVPYKSHKLGGIITGGVGHDERNAIGDQGIPVVPTEEFEKGGKYNKEHKVAEIEDGEIIFNKETADKIDKLVDEYADCKCPGKLVQLGKLIKEAIGELSDETCRRECKYVPKLKQIKG